MTFFNTRLPLGILHESMHKNQWVGYISILLIMLRLTITKLRNLRKVGIQIKIKLFLLLFS